MNPGGNPPTDAGVEVRPATDSDMDAIQAIYAHHVLHGLASFEETPPDSAEMLRRRRDIEARGLPYIVARLEVRLAGFAYAAPFRPRPAYRYSVENSVYVAPDAGRRGAGEKLLRELIRLCAGKGIRQMIAVIGDTGNAPSINLHAKLGFQRMGSLTAVGFKFGRWVNSVYMQLPLGEGATTLPREE